MSDEQAQSTIVIDVEAGERVSIGEDVVVELVAKSGRHARLKFRAPRSATIRVDPVVLVATSMAR